MGERKREREKTREFKEKKPIDRPMAEVNRCRVPAASRLVYPDRVLAWFSCAFSVLHWLHGWF